MTSYNWDHYHINNKVNADKLFLSLLEEIKKHGININKTFTIQEIASLIPKGTAGINNNSVYGFSMMSMFSKQKERDYFIFDNVNLSDEFTAVCNNNANRNNYHWRNFADTQLVINPKYARKFEELIK